MSNHAPLDPTNEGPNSNGSVTPDTAMMSVPVGLYKVTIVGVTLIGVDLPALVLAGWLLLFAFPALLTEWGR